MKRFALALFLSTFAIQTFADDFKIVVNRANPVSSMTKSEIADYLMKVKKTWPDQKPVVPVDQLMSSPVRQQVSQQVLGRPAAAMKNFWNQQIFSGHEVPPVEYENDHRIIEFVRATPGAIGYVSASAHTEDVKVVTVR